MFYQFIGNKLKEVAKDGIEPDQSLLAFVEPEEAGEILSLFSLPARPMEIALSGKTMVHESHEGFDFACLRKLGFDLSEASGQVCLYHSRNLLLFTGRGLEEVRDDLLRHMEGKEGGLNLERLLIRFLEGFTSRSPTELEEIEDEIEDLEMRVLSDKGGDVIHELLALRKELTSYKHHYEQLLFVLDMFAEDEGDLVSVKGGRALQLLSRRTSRLHQSILDLQSYVTQVRESYQAEMDIRLNRIMKLFTAVTSIFLPLTLIAGWYGMNLQMPEYEWELAYPLVAIGSLVILVLLMVYFKRNKWF